MSLTLLHGLQQGHVTDTFNQIVDRWNQANPDFSVKTQTFNDYGRPVTEALAASDADQANFVLAPEFMTGKMMTACGDKKVVPIHQLLPGGQLEAIAEIVKRTFGDAQGNLFSLPFNPSCGVLYANAHLVKEMPRTYEELETLCLELMKKREETPATDKEVETVFSEAIETKEEMPRTDKQLKALSSEAIQKLEGGYTCAWPAAYLLEVPAAQRNLPLALPENGKLGHGRYKLSKADELTKADELSEADKDWVYQHLLHLRDLARKKVFIYAGQTNDAKQPFLEGRVAFFLQGAVHATTLEKEAPFPLRTAPLPTLSLGQKEKHAFPLGGASIWVLDNTKTKQMIDGVRGFLSYLASEDVQIEWHKKTGYVPVLKDLPAKLADFYQTHPIHQAVVEQTLQATLGKFSFGVQMPNYAEARKAIFTLIEEILKTVPTEGPDVKYVLDDAQVLDLLKKFDKDYSLPRSL